MKHPPYFMVFTMKQRWFFSYSYVSLLGYWWIYCSSWKIPCCSKHSLQCYFPFHNAPSDSFTHTFWCRRIVGCWCLNYQWKKTHPSLPWEHWIWEKMCSLVWNRGENSVFWWRCENPLPKLRLEFSSALIHSGWSQKFFHQQYERNRPILLPQKTNISPEKSNGWESMKFHSF